MVARNLHGFKKMPDREMLLELTESYLKFLIAEASASLGADFESSTPFGELGIDSFRILKIIKALEKDFGTLPKTLLFECFNVEALARYFADKHCHVLTARFSKDQQPAGPAAAEMPTNAGAAVRNAPTLPTPTPTPAPGVVQTPIRLLEKFARASETDASQDLFERHKNGVAFPGHAQHCAQPLHRQ
jgi:polyketide synthase PksN